MRRPASAANYDAALVFVAAIRSPVGSASRICWKGPAAPTLYRAIQSYGGVSAYVVSERLEAARALQERRSLLQA